MSDEYPRNANKLFNSQFHEIPKGMVECPKCFGATELDLTNRDASGWPLGPPTRRTCDHCDGDGSVTPDKGDNPALMVIIAPGWGMPVREEVVWDSPLTGGPIKFIEPPKPLPNETVAAGWAIFDKGKQ